MVTSPLLVTKLHIPIPRSNLVHRQRLIEQLDTGMNAKLTLISAPAGFGKSTLLSHWVKQTAAHAHFAWLSLDEGDNDLARFLTYFVAALQTINSKVGDGALVALQSPGAVKTETILISLLNDVAAIPDELILVLDDYHEIDSQQIDRAIIYLLDHLPAQMHLVISSRIDPSLYLSRLRARGQMIEIRADDLRFTPDEAEEFLVRVMGFALSMQDVVALEARTEGWITGLQLAALSMRSSDDVQAFVRSFTGSNRYILDYLGDEVIAHQVQQVQDFLLKTSVLNRLTGSLCDVLTGDNDGEQTLENLEQSNLFIVPLDNERKWYRYHHLFSDLLRRQLHHLYPDMESTLHDRASEWYAQQGFQVDAVYHALTGGNFEKAADLIEASGLDLIGRGEFVAVQEWIAALPVSLVEERSTLCVFQAWTFNFTHQLDAIEACLLNAQGALDDLGAAPDDKRSKDIHGHIAALRAWDARRQRDNALAIKLLLDAEDKLGAEHSFVRTFAALNLGLAYMDSGELIKAADALSDAMSQGYESHNELASLIATSYLAAVFILQGRLHQAERLCRQTIQEQARNHESPPPGLCMIYLRLGWVLAEWNNVDGYFDNLSQGIILADQIGYDSVVFAGAISMVWEKQIIAEQGRVIEFSKDVNEIINRSVKDGRTVGEIPTPSKERDVQAALEAQNINIYLTDDAYFEVWPGYSDIAQAKKWIDEGKVEQALDLLAQVYESAQAVEGIGLMIEARSSEALICHAHGDTERAMRALTDALELSEPRDYMRTYLDRAAPMQKLLSEAASRGIMPHYTARLLAGFDAGAKVTSGPLSQALIEPLSNRELEILQLVAAGLSNREISERLFLAMSTVKGHNRNIYGKLQVQRRTEAVARARELGLIED
jgi:ATP/maltotriose-dependent transcriptional regulator MalT